MSWILTKTGKQFDAREPKVETVDIEDIAHALSNMCRFNGHCTEFYSVAQHSVHVSYLVPPGQELAALMHDASEAYISDVTSPVKRYLTGYAALEHRIQEVIARRFHFPAEMTPDMKRADLIMLATERRDLMPKHPAEWDCLRGIVPHDRRLIPMPPKEAKAFFMDRFEYLMYGGLAARTWL